MKKDKIIIYAFIIFMAILLIFMYMFYKVRPVKKTEYLLDTVCTIEIHNLSEHKGNELLKKAFSKCHEFESILSKTDKDSDIYKINHANGKEVKVSDTTIAVIKSAIETSRQTNGRFDISVGRITELWDFTSTSPKIPEYTNIQKVLNTVGYENIIIKGNRVQLVNPETHLDTGGIAKGYIALEISAFLEKNGVTEGIINLGGDIITIGNSGSSGKWKIGIEKPESRGITGMIEAENNSVFTSGTYERCFEKDGIIYHHILDPETGYPARTDLTSATIISSKDNAIQCDAYATICILEGSERAADFMKDKKGYEYCFITDRDKIIKSEGFDMK